VIGMPLEEAIPSQFQRASAQMAQQRLDAVMVSTSGEFLANRQLIVDFATSCRDCRECTPIAILWKGVG
jgi:hypothetical protein